MTLTKQKPKRTTVTHRKRTGQHHRKGEHYIKAYWPYLPIFAVLGLGIVLNSWIGHANHGVLGYATNVSSSVLLAETNNARAAENEQPLTINAQLNDAAQAKANDMAKRDYWSHVTPDGVQPWAFIQNAGYQYQSAGENLAYGFGTSTQVIGAWMGSTEHRANMLNANYSQVGFATTNVAEYQGHGPETIVVAEYAQPIGAAAVAQNTPVTDEATNAPQAVSRIQLVNNATWLQLGLAALCGATLVLFFVRHTIAWHKVLVKSERFALKHPLIDIGMIALIVIGLVFTHTAGSIL